MPDIQELAPSEVTRTSRFAQFLRSAVAIKSRPVTEVQQYPTVEWFSTMPTDLDEVRSPLFTTHWPSDDLRWLTVARVPEPPCPAPPEECRPWLVDVDLDSPATPPNLNASYARRSPKGEAVQVPPGPDLVGMWDRYI